MFALIPKIANEKRFTQMMDKVKNKNTISERQNGDLKCKIKQINYKTTLEKELMKTKLETKWELLTQKK